MKSEIIGESVYRQYLAALIAGDRFQCSNIVMHLLEQKVQTEKLYTEIFQKSLYRVGELWEQNKLSVAVEHLATALTEYLLASVYPSILADRVQNGRKAVISCSVNEYHQVGARMVADIMESLGWDVWFLGANTPVEDLLVMIQDKKPDVLGLSVSIYFNIANLLKMMETVRLHYPGLDIFVGGQAFRWGGRDLIASHKNVITIPTLKELIRTIET